MAVARTMLEQPGPSLGSVSPPDELPGLTPLVQGLVVVASLSSSLMSPTGFPGGSAVKNPPASAGDAALIPESGRSPGEGNGNPHQHSCLENSMDRGA